MICLWILKITPAFSRSYRMTTALCAFLLFFSTVIGYMVWQEDSALAQQVVEQVIQTKFSPLVAKMQTTNWIGRIWIILGNNLLASILLVFSGGILPILPVILGVIPNGTMIGLMAGYYEYQQLAKSTFFLGILPHGVFEIPAILLAATVGVIWGVRNWRNLMLERRRHTFLAQTKESLSFLPLIITLLVIASLVEVLVTPALLQAGLPG
jgi:stage II sporulation protein M